MQNTTQTKTVCESPVKYSHIGIVIDNSSFSADDCNLETIEFAEQFGFKYEPLLSENDEDYGQILSETADDAVSFLNDHLELPSFCSFYFEDNSLFMSPCVENAREDVGFVSSRVSDYPAADYEGEWLHVNDHGNATLYVRNDKGEDTEIWSIV